MVFKKFGSAVSNAFSECATPLRVAIMSDGKVLRAV